jgi:hypothetical protein
MATPNLVLISELQTLTRRDFPVADGTVVPAPQLANALVDGEWLELNSSYAGWHAARPASAASTRPTSPRTSSTPSVVATTSQALSKVNVLFMGMYEAETSIVRGGRCLSVGGPVTVQDVNILGFADPAWPRS